MNRIATIGDLAKFTPKLAELHASLDGKWEPDLTQQEFLSELLLNFTEGAYYFGDFTQEGELTYFVAITQQGPRKALFWLFYMNPAFRETTKPLLNNLKGYLKNEGFDVVYSQSTRTASSYERWLEKFGAEKVAITYKFKL